ncbi:MAG: DUF3500 domain-containing protein [Verrucomicrobiota bacterium]
MHKWIQSFISCSVLICSLLMFGSTTSFSNESEAVVPLVKSAQEFLDILDDEQRNQVLLTFEGNQRFDWHYFPKDRKGLAWKEMNESQQKLSWAFLKTALSPAGYQKVQGVVAAERVLWENSGHRDSRDPDRYYLTIFGEPSTTQTWGASLEGHHLSINLTVIKGKEVFVTPSFLGSNPDQLQDGQRPLAGEFDQAHQLLGMLNEEQLAQAIIAKRAIREIVTGSDRKVDALKPEGLAASDMGKEQVEQLMRVVQEYVGRYREEFAQDDLAKMEAAGISNIRFLWAGGSEAGEPVYYRIQGPTFIMEYANTQGGANHSHTVWRDFENDFGYDALKAHIESEH